MPLEYPSHSPAVRTVLVTGGSGYLGRALIPHLTVRGHRVRALVRPGSGKKLPSGTEAVPGDPLNADHVAAALAGADTLVHLVGVPKPSPAKARQFRAIDLVSVQAAVAAAARALPRPHLVYLSVAQPAPVMKAYVEVRREGEAVIRASGLDATLLRPWYVLGPGHRWPAVLLPCMRCCVACPRPAPRRSGSASSRSHRWCTRWFARWSNRHTAFASWKCRKSGAG